MNKDTGIIAWAYNNLFEESNTKTNHLVYLSDENVAPLSSGLVLTPCIIRPKADDNILLKKGKVLRLENRAVKGERDLLKIKLEEVRVTIAMESMGYYEMTDKIKQILDR